MAVVFGKSRAGFVRKSGTAGRAARPCENPQVCCMYPATPVFLVIDFNHDSRFLLVKTLRRKFPQATIEECDEADPAIAYLQSRSVTAVITHRSIDTPGLDLVRQLHEVEPGVPIVMVSGIERAEAALAAGATAFLHYDEWLRIGTVVDTLLKTHAGGSVAGAPMGPAGQTEQ